MPDFVSGYDRQQGQTATELANMLRQMQVTQGQQDVAAQGNQEGILQAMLPKGGPAPQPGAPAPATPPSGMPQMPMPGAAPLPPALQSTAPIPPPMNPQAAQAALQAPQSAQPDAQSGQAPQMDPQTHAVIAQNLQGPQATQWQDFIKASKEAMPDASPQQRMAAVRAAMETVGHQTNTLMKSLQQQILMGKVNGSLTPGELTQIVDQYAAGNQNVLTRLSEGDRRQVFDELNKRGSGQDAADAATRYHGEQSRSAAAGRQTGNIDVAAEGFKAIAPKALEASAAVPRSSWKSIAGMQNWLKEQSNDPAFAQFQAFNLGLVREYARSMGGTVSAQNHANDVLGTAKDPTAYAAAVDALNQEIELAQQGGERAISGQRSQSSAPHISGSPPAHDPLGILQ